MDPSSRQGIAMSRTCWRARRPAIKSGQPDGWAGRVGRPAACQAWKPPSWKLQ